MKKISILLFALVATVAAAQDDLSFENIRNQWMYSSISAPGIGQNPSVIKLVAAFEKQWHTWMGESIVKKASAPGFSFYEDPEQFWAITYDAKMNYVFINSTENEGGTMHALSLPMKNGHSLLCVAISNPFDQGDMIMCYYDYDPAKSSMKPWDGAPDTGYSKLSDKTQLSVNLPSDRQMYFFQEYVSRELEDGEIYFFVRKYYKWDGMEFDFDVTEISGLYDMKEQYDEWWKKGGRRRFSHPQFSRISLIDVDDDGIPEVYLSDEKGVCEAVYTIGSGNPVMISAADENHSIGFFNRAVCSWGKTEMADDVIVMEYSLVDKSRSDVVFCAVKSATDEDGPETYYISDRKDVKKELTASQASKYIRELGKQKEVNPVWKDIE